MFRGRSTCQLFGPARAAIVICLTIVALPRPSMAAEAKASGGSPFPQTALINQHVSAHWEASNLTPSPAANDGEWCRRVYLDILGRVPTVAELEQFLKEPAAQRKVQLAARLLGDEYIEDYAANWTTQWMNVLVGRAAGNDNRSPVNREGLSQALRRALQRNMPYDRLVAELVSAEGVNTPGEAGFNGFVNYLVGSLDENAVQATAKTAQIFLGLQIQCTQCHNHPFNDWKQNQFWEMNAFFRQTRAVRQRDGNRRSQLVELVNRDFAGENNEPGEAVLFYELRNGLSKAAYPVFVDGQKLPTDSGRVDEIDRREELSKLIVGSEYLAPAAVNRIWAHFLGYGFTKPVDDMGPHNPPSHPELLAALAEEFKKHSYDLKQLMTWIVLSEPYALSSKVTPRNKQDDPALGVKPAFSHFYLRQMRAEELYESLLTATEADRAATSYEAREAQKRDWLSQFTVAFGTDDNGESTTFNGTIPQALMMMNGDLIERATSVEKGSFLERVANDSKLSNPLKIQKLYLAALARRPTGQEISLANELMRLRKGDSVAALQDVWWALLNSNEFIFNH